MAGLFLHLLVVLGASCPSHGPHDLLRTLFHFVLKAGWKFCDADDYHPRKIGMKMQKGIALNDKVRCTVCFYFQQMSQLSDAGEDACSAWCSPKSLTQDSAPEAKPSSSAMYVSCGPELLSKL